MESPGGIPESPMEQDDAAYPCKGCGEILEEGKAFELAGYRWHIDCFRCNTCTTLLDSDANLLLLGDGSLICNNCTYSCSACGNKIEDLAILTGDQAFCATCFKCRNCKKKIENLKYARTSQGIFCMDCHESLMARRRKKTVKHSLNRYKQPGTNNMLLDKSLPSLPPNVYQSSFSPDQDSPPSESYTETPTELPAHPSSAAPPPPFRPPNLRKDSTKGTHPEKMPAPPPPRPPEYEYSDGLALPTNDYRNNRHSAISQRSNASGNGEGFFIPMALDPNPAPGPSPLSRSQQFDDHKENVKPKVTDPKAGSRDYFTAKVPSVASRHFSPDHHSSPTVNKTVSQTTTPRDESQPGSPQIIHQEKVRTPFSDKIDAVRKRKEHMNTHKNSNGASLSNVQEKDHNETGGMRRGRDKEGDDDAFRLQEAPRSRKKSETSPAIDNNLSAGVSKSAPPTASTQTKDAQFPMPASNSPRSVQPDAMSQGSPRISQEFRGADNGSQDSPKSRYSPIVSQAQKLPQRGDSLGATTPKQQAIVRKDVGTGSSLNIAMSPPIVDGHEYPQSAPPASAAQASQNAFAKTKVNGGRTLIKPMESPTSKPTPPARARDRPTYVLNPAGDHFVSPRPPPQLPAEYEHQLSPRAPIQPPPDHEHGTRNPSISTVQSDVARNEEQPISPKLPRSSTGGEFTMEEDMARILGGEAHMGHPDASFLRRVSNSVRHARSYSDRGIRLSKEQRWTKSPLAGSPGVGFGKEISSPTSSSPEDRDEIPYLKNELQRERQRRVEREQKIADLEAAVEGRTNIRRMTLELHEKRSTMVILDAQKEIALEEIGMMTRHITAAKKTSERLDFGRFKNQAVKDLYEALESLKDKMTPQIEALIEQKNDAIEEFASLTQLKERSLQEFEQLSSKNAQLMEMNNQLVGQIQELYKANAAPSPMDSLKSSQSNGLGIYTHHQNDTSSVSIDRELRPSITDGQLSGSTIIQEHDIEPAVMVAQPQMVNIRKATPKKSIWKKGGQSVAKGVTKGFKGAFTSNEQNKHDQQTPEAIPYGAIPSSSDYPSGSISRASNNDPVRQGLGRFNNQKAKPATGRAVLNGAPPVHVEAPSVLFGSELEQRLEYEKASIPGIVTRCIQEVELRGMDVEGIYRKSGGNSQIQQIKEGLERSNDYDISDPDLDIHAITSTLKQYLRKLPTPLIPYEVYDRLMETNADQDSKIRIDLMRSALHDDSVMPQRYRDTLGFLVFHLARVVDKQAENRMPSMNVAVVFAPTIMRPLDVMREMTESNAKNLAVQFLIENCQAVFLGPN